MKLFSILTVAFAAFCLNFCHADQNQKSSDSEVSVLPIKNIELQDIDFANLPKDPAGNLAPVVKDEKAENNTFIELIRSRVQISPHAETLAYVNGQLCHVGNYAQSIIYTVLEGPYFGTQTTVTYDGILLYVNTDFDVEYLYEGTILYHYYPDSKVITGSNQIVKFY